MYIYRIGEPDEAVYDLHVSSVQREYCDNNNIPLHVAETGVVDLTGMTFRSFRDVVQHAGASVPADDWQEEGGVA